MPDPHIHLERGLLQGGEIKAEGEVGLSVPDPGPVCHRLCLRHPGAEVAAPVEEGEKVREEAQKAENPEKPQEPVTNDEKSA